MSTKTAAALVGGRATGEPMYLKITRQCWVEGENRPIDSEIEVDASLARQLVNAGQAVEIDALTPKPKGKASTPKAKGRAKPPTVDD